MLHHVEIYVSDLETSRAFWSGALAFLGYEQTGEWPGGFTLSGGQDAYLTFVQVEERHRVHPYHRCGVGLNHLAFRATDRAQLDRIRAYCHASGAAELYADRYPYATGTNYCALYVEDPDRIKVEFVASEPG